MSIVVNLPDCTPKFFSSLYNHAVYCVDSNFQEEENKLYFLTYSGLIELFDNQCTLYKFKKPVSHFAKILLTKEYIVCFLEKKIVFINKNDLTELKYTYHNKRPLVGQPCCINNEIYFMDTKSLKKISLQDFEITELYNFKVEGKILIEMSDIIKHGEYIVFYNRNDSLIFINKEGVVEKKLTFPIINQSITKEQAKMIVKNHKKFFALENGDIKLKMNFQLESFPIVYKNHLFLKSRKWIMCIDDKLNLTFLRSKKKINLIAPNDKNSMLKPIKDIESVNLREKVKYNFNIKDKIIAFYREKFALVLRGRILSIKTDAQFKDYLIDQKLNPKSLFGWVNKDIVHVIILDINGEIYKFEFPLKSSKEDKDSDVKAKAVPIKKSFFK